MLYGLIGLFVVYGLAHVCYRQLFQTLFESYLKNDFSRKIQLRDLSK